MSDKRSDLGTDIDSIDAETLQQKLAHYADRGVSQVKLGLTDIDGVIRGKYVGIDKFISLLKKQGGFCDVSLVGTWTINSTMLEPTPDGILAFPIQAFASSWKPSVGCRTKTVHISLASLSARMAPTTLCVLVRV